MTRAEQLVKRLGSAIVAPSKVVAALLEILGEVEHTRIDVENVLRTDATFAAEVLRLANSARYSRRSVSDLGAALMLLGEQELSRIAVRAGARCMKVPEVEGYGMADGGLWLQSLRTAVATELLATNTGLAEPGVAYTAGILLDVGKRLLGPELEEELEDAIDASDNDNESFIDVERSLLGCDHAEVGAVLVKSWSLPDELVEAVRWHHAPERAEEAGALVWLCHLGDFLSSSLSGAGSVEGTAYRLNEGWSQVVSIAEDELIGLLPTIAERAEEALGEFEEEAA
ncbi:MAG: HDOD domain-containing protein [Myxococcales bacterium]|nr:HDOD domain-containing protein [Myxococcales bacterium]